MFFKFNLDVILASNPKRIRLSSINSQNKAGCGSIKPEQLPSMNKLKSDQKTKVRSFIQCTQSNEQTALICLTRANWNMDYAVDMYFQSQHQFQQQPPSASKYNIEKLYTTYANDRNDVADGCSNKIGPNGIQRLLNDMRLDPMDRRVLLLACKLKAQTQCEFSWDEWSNGLTALRADTADALRESLNQLEADLSDPARFRELYTFTFSYGKPTSQRNLDMESAIAYWRILFQDKFPLMDLWEEFLRKEHGAAITKDTWNLLLDFCFNIKPDLSNYDDDGAWPVLIDQFVDYARKRLDLPQPVEA